MTFYDRAVAGLSRRELLKIGWMLGAAAVAQPLSSRRLLAKPIFDAYPFSLGVASGDPLPDGVVLWTRLAPSRSKAAACRWRSSTSTGRSRATRAFRTIVQHGHRAGAAGARAQRARRGRRARAGARVLLSLPRRRRSEPDRPHQDRAAAGAAGRSPALRRLRLPALRGRLLHRVPADRRGAVRLRLPHRRLHLRRSRRRRPERSAASASTTATRSTRSSTIATATRSTRSIRI